MLAKLIAAMDDIAIADNSINKNLVFTNAIVIEKSHKHCCDFAQLIILAYFAVELFRTNATNR